MAFEGPLAFLDLEQIDTDLYRGSGETWPGERANIYGGQVAAQALLAASLTVPEGRLPHSLHGYFLRSGDPHRQVVFEVDRDRDGRSFSARRVAAKQRGEVIFEMACSFHVPEGGPEFASPARHPLPAPDGLPSSVGVAWQGAIEVRAVPLGGPERAENPIDCMWTRVNVPLPDDPVVHACLLAFLSDLNGGFGYLGIPGVPVFGPSIDHAVWFHHAARADEWILFDCHPLKVGGGRGVYMGSAHDIGGNLVMMLAQEMLLRSPRPEGS